MIIPWFSGNMKIIVPHSFKSSFAGWGVGSNSRYLYQVYLEWIEQAVCEQELNPGFIPEDMICAGSASGGRDTCHVSSIFLCVSVPDFSLKWVIRSFLVENQPIILSIMQ